MPIMVFENRNEATLILTVGPWEHRHEVPHLAEAGIRYAVTEGSEDRSYSSVSELGIEFWCNADSYEIDIVLPSPKDRLLWEICVLGGWCGGLVDGEPCHVQDLVPKTGIVTAEEFAQLTVKADGWPRSAPPKEHHLRWLEAKFVEHLGGPSADAEILHHFTRRPFDGV